MVVADEPFEDATLIMEVLAGIRADVRHVIHLLEEDDGEEEEEDA
jgi:hypothetical protein